MAYSRRIRWLLAWTAIAALALAACTSGASDINTSQAPAAAGQSAVASTTASRSLSPSAAAATATATATASSVSAAIAASPAAGSISSVSASVQSTATAAAAEPAAAQATTPVTAAAAPAPAAITTAPATTSVAAPASTAPTSTNTTVAAPAAAPTGRAAPRARAGNLPLHPFVPADGRPRIVALDAGHGGDEVGSAGAGVAEKNVNLSIARRLRAYLEADGYQVVMVRDCDCRATPPPGYEPVDTSRPTRWDLQARIDLANLAGADVFISIHNNGSPNPGDSGTEVWWDGRRPFADYNGALATDVLDSLVAAIRGAGYPTINRGLKEDSNFRVFQGRSFPIFVLGPPRSSPTAPTSRAGAMPAVLGETLFLSNGAEAVQLTRDAMLDAIARGYREGLRRYFARIDNGELVPPVEGFVPDAPTYYDVTPPGQGGR